MITPSKVGQSRQTVDVVNVNEWEPLDRRSYSLVPSGVENGRTEIVHTRWIRIGFGLCTEDWTIKDHICNVVDHMIFNFDKVGLPEDNNLDRFRRVTRGVF
jgi:hypothetical protein